MSERDELHRLVEELPDEQVPAALAEASVFFMACANTEWRKPTAAARSAHS